MAEETSTKPKGKGSPESYIKLAKISLGLQEFQIAAAACEKGLAKFPQNPGLLVARGETLVLAYNFGKKTEHLKSALESFEYALKINPHNYTAKFLTGQIYIQLKKYDLAAKRFSSILEIDPNDIRAKSLLEKAQGKMAPPKEKPKAAPVSAVKEKMEDKPEEEQIQEKEALAGDQKEGILDMAEGDESANHEFLISRLGIFQKLEGIKSINLVDKNGNLLKCQKKSDLDPELLSSMAGNVYRSTVRVVDRFHSGDFVYGMVMCQKSYVYIVAVRWAVLVLETSTDASLEVLEKKIHQYLGELDL